MPQVPYSPVNKELPQGGFVSSATPESYGAGVAKAIGGFGQELQKASDTATQVALDENQLANESLAKEATVRWEEGSGELSAAYFSLRGKAAVDSRAKFIEDMKALRDTTLSSLPSPMSRRIADSTITWSLGRTLNSAAQHSSTELKNWSAEASASRADSLIDKASLAPEDDILFKTSLNGAFEEIRQQAQIIGKPVEWVESQIKAATSKAWRLRIQQEEINNSLRAQDMYRKALPQLLPEDVVTLGKSTKAAAYSTLSRFGADSIVRGQGVVQDVDTLFENGVKWKEGGKTGEANVKGAVGTSQILVGSARDMAAHLGIPFDEERLKTDKAYNELLGKQYLREQIARFSGSQTLALAAYNAGPDAVQQWLRRFGDPREGPITEEQWIEKIPFPETKDYVMAINARVKPPEGTIATEDDVTKHLGDWIKDADAYAETVAPGDPAFRDMMESRVQTHANLIVAAKRQEEKQRSDVLITAVMGSGNPDGPPTTEEELFEDVRAHAAFVLASPTTQQSIRRDLEHNAEQIKRDFTLEQYDTWYKMRHLMAEEPAEFLKVNIAELDLPLSRKMELARKQTNMMSKMQTDVNLQSSLATVKSEIAVYNESASASDRIDIKKNPDAYRIFIGKFLTAADQFHQEHGRLPNTQDKINITRDLLRIDATKLPSYFIPGPLPGAAYETIKKAQDAYKRRFGRDPDPSQLDAMLRYVEGHPE